MPEVWTVHVAGTAERPLGPGTTVRQVLALLRTSERGRVLRRTPDLVEVYVPGLDLDHLRPADVMRGETWPTVQLRRI